MNRWVRTLSMLGMSLLLLVACGESKPPEKTVLDPQLQAIKKAREVEQKLEDSAQRQREQIERQERGEK